MIEAPTRRSGPRKGRFQDILSAVQSDQITMDRTPDAGCVASCQDPIPVHDILVAVAAELLAGLV